MFSGSGQVKLHLVKFHIKEPLPLKSTIALWATTHSAITIS